jgi:TAT (twin-arginine translocation) pathway-exported protein
MNRRKFLKWVGVGAAATTVAYSLSFGRIDPILNEFIPEDAIIGEYNNYVNFSSFSVSEAIDPVVMAAATELCAQRIKMENLWLTT